MKDPDYDFEDKLEKVNFVGAKRLTIIGLACIALLMWLGWLRMIIDLTEAFNVVHHLWDIFGCLLAIGFGAFIPVSIVAASLIKISEYRKSNKDKGELWVKNY